MRSSKWFVPFIIVVLIIAAVFVPILNAGYAEIEQAETAYSTGKYLEALSSFENAARLLPWRIDLWERAAEAALFAEQPEKTILYISRFDQPTQFGYLLLGNAFLQLDEYDSALNAFRSALDVYGPSASAYAGLAEGYRNLKAWSAEFEALQNQLQLDVSNAGLHYRLGLLLSVMDSEQAMTDLMLASALDPEFDPAVQTLRTALNLSSAQPDPSQQMVTIGRALGLVNEWALSASAFEKAIELDPKNAEAWAWLGEAKQQLVGALSRSAETVEAMSKGQDGRAELDMALTLDGRSVVVRGLRGLYWNRQGKYSQALSEYLLAAGIEPENPAWQASIGEAYAHLGDLASALTAHQRATELAPDDATYWRLLAVFCAGNGIHVEDVGLPAAQKAVELAPDDPLALDALGWSYLSSGRYYNAEQALTDVIARTPEYLPARLHLAMTYLAQGRPASAYPELIHVRDADPNGADGQLAVQLLKRYFP